MKKICIIPARGGSKRLPRKNLKLLNGKPLIFHTIDSAIDSNIFDKIIFTSDSKEILKLVSTNYPYKLIETFKRPPEFACDTSKVIETIKYYFQRLVFDNINKSYNYDQIWQSLPTCPLRTSNDIIQANQLLTANIHSVISITDVEFPPTLSLVKDDKSIISSSDPSKPWENGNSRSQDHPLKYKPNGAIYGMWSKSFETFYNFYTDLTVGYCMPRERSIDIDSQFDFDLAKKILNA